jgi:hypothetical protein
MTLAGASSTSAPPDVGRLVMPFGLSPDTGQRVLSFGDELDDGQGDMDTQSMGNLQMAGRDQVNKRWLLRPEVFSQLSSAGQRAALLMNGRLKFEGGAGQPIPRRSEVVPESAIGDNIRVNNPVLDTGFHTHSETSVAVNGSNVIVSFNESAGSTFDGYGISSDGGTTFTHKRIPSASNGANLGDGVVAFGPGGEIYYSTLAEVVTTGGNVKSFVGVSKSTDNGVTFSTPFDASTTAGNNVDFQDKEWVTVDRNVTSQFKGNVYVSWTDFTALPSGQSNGSFINFARSTNGGATFEAPQALSAQDHTSDVQGSMPVVAPNGDLYVAFRDTHSGFGGMAIRKSTDGGKTFLPENKVVSLLSISAMTGGGAVRTNSFPSITVDNNGVVHIVYDAWSGSQLDRSDILYVRSSDGGNTWSQALKLNDDGTPTTQFLPSIAAAADGTLGVKWWDRRNDPLNDSLTDVYMTISHDGGTTFGKNFRVTDQNWVFGPIETVFASGYHGDYDDIASDGNNFMLSWSDERAGEADAYFAEVPENRDGGAPDFNISAKKLFDNITAGDSATFDLSTKVTNAFSGSLALSASPVISGMAYSFAKSSINAGDTASVTVSTSSGVQPGTYLITVAATGSGVTRKTNFRLTVLDPNRFAGVPSNASGTKGFTTMQSGIKADTGGTVHVVFDDDSADVRLDDVFYSQSSNGGQSYSTPIKVSGPSPNVASESTLNLDSAGNPYIVWTSFSPTPQQSRSIFLSKSTDHGTTFSKPVVASGPSVNAQNPRVVIDKNGNIAIVYVDFATSGGAAIFEVRSTDGGATFSLPSRVSQAGEALDNPPFVAVDSQGAVYVTYDEISQAAVIKLAVAPDGHTFGSSRTISDSRISTFAPQIAVDNSDNLYVTFYDRFPVGSNFNREIIVIKSRDKGATFGPQVNVSNNSGQSTFPSPIVDAQGRLSIVWEETTSDPERDVYLARSGDGGMTFGPSINLSANSSRSFGAFGSADGAGNLFIGWTDDSPANTDVFVATMNAASVGPPDFALGGSTAIVTMQRATKTQFTIDISRVGGFTGNVTVETPDLSSVKIKQPGGNIQSTTGGSVTFALKLKAGGPTGPLLVPLIGLDGSGRTRQCYVEFIIQPATQ